MSTPRHEAQGLTLKWLERDYPRVFTAQLATYRGNSRRALEDITGSTVVEDKRQGTAQPHQRDGVLHRHWEQYLAARSRYETTEGDSAFFAASYHVLRATAVAQTTLAWRGMLLGQRHADRAQDMNIFTLGLLNQHFLVMGTDKVDFPEADMLDEPFADAIAPARTVEITGKYDAVFSVFTALGGLTVRHLMEQERVLGAYYIPTPGEPTDAILPWAEHPPTAHQPA